MARKPAPLTGEKARDYSGIAEKLRAFGHNPRAAHMLRGKRHEY
jgi:hypothetical protein